MLSKFRQFDQSDWQAFGGCESERPLINDEQEKLVVVIDERTVHVLYDGLCYRRQFPDRRLAYDFACLALASPETMTHYRFEILFGESIGGY